MLDVAQAAAALGVPQEASCAAVWAAEAARRRVRPVCLRASDLALDPAQWPGPGPPAHGRGLRPSSAAAPPPQVVP